jgi:5-methyltetrahydropteroyltriglutamate--homocysteine methyltransferase
MSITTAAKSWRGKFAKILNQEAREIEAAGVDVIQFDEPAFNVFFDEVRDWGIKALELAAEGLACKTAVHICYGYGIRENIDWKKTLGSEWRQYENTFPLLRASKIDQVSLECHNSKVPMALIELLKGKDVLVGAIDVTTNQIETPEEVAATLRKALQYVAAGKSHPWHQLRHGTTGAPRRAGQAECTDSRRSDCEKGSGKRNQVYSWLITHKV